jgi:hypothetical protein
MYSKVFILISVIFLFSCSEKSSKNDQETNDQQTSTEVNKDSVDLKTEPEKIEGWPDNWPVKFSCVHFADGVMMKDCEDIFYVSESENFGVGNIGSYDSYKVIDRKYDASKDELKMSLVTPNGQTLIYLLKTDTEKKGLFACSIYYEKDFNEGKSPYTTEKWYDMYLANDKSIEKDCEFPDEESDRLPKLCENVIGISVCREMKSASDKFSFSAEIKEGGLLSGEASEDIGNDLAKMDSGKWECVDGHLFLTFLMKGTKMTDEGMKDYVYEKIFVISTWQILNGLINNCK